MADWYNGWLMQWSIDAMVDWYNMVEQLRWLIDTMVDWYNGWLIQWLIDKWLIDAMVEETPPPVGQNLIGEAEVEASHVKSFIARVYSKVAHNNLYGVVEGCVLRR